MLSRSAGTVAVAEEDGKTMQVGLIY